MKTSTKLKTEMYALVTRWEESGMSQKAFCKSVSVNYSRFKYWRKRKNKECQTNHQIPCELKKPEERFISVEIPLSKHNFSGIRLVYPNGVMLQCTEEIKIDQLQQLIKLY